jgi:hypothetical protein
VDFDGADGILVEGVVSDAQDGGEDCVMCICIGCISISAFAVLAVLAALYRCERNDAEVNACF